MSTVAAHPVEHRLGGAIPDQFGAIYIVATLLLIWVRLDPFHDLSSVENIQAWESGSQATQIAYTLLGLVSAAIVVQMGPGRLRALLTWPFLLTLGWIGLSILFSVAPALSLRRSMLMDITFLASATLLLCARSPRQFADLMGWTALGIVIVCYVSIVIVPDLAMHTALDLREPEHAGSWRGLFPHKNHAGALMCEFVIVGLFQARAGNRAAGIILTVLAAVFLVFTRSKTSIAVLPLVLLGVSLTYVFRSAVMRALILLGPIALFVTVTLGSTFFPPVKAVLSTVMSDTSFTGRTDIWEFAAANIAKRPIFGWGYQAFWKTEATLYGSDTTSWASGADQAHNGFIDIAIFMGWPGLVISLVFLVVQPLRDFQRATAGGPPDPLAIFFLRTWYFCLAVASFESVFFNGNTNPFFSLMIAIFGLRFLAAHGVARRAR